MSSTFIFIGITLNMICAPQRNGNSVVECRIAACYYPEVISSILVRSFQVFRLGGVSSSLDGLKLDFLFVFGWQELGVRFFRGFSLLINVNHVLGVYMVKAVHACIALVNLFVYAAIPSDL